MHAVLRGGDEAGEARRSRGLHEVGGPGGKARHVPVAGEHGADAHHDAGLRCERIEPARRADTGRAHPVGQVARERLRGDPGRLDLERCRESRPRQGEEVRCRAEGAEVCGTAQLDSCGDRPNAEQGIPRRRSPGGEGRERTGAEESYEASTRKHAHAGLRLEGSEGAVPSEAPLGRPPGSGPAGTATQPPCPPGLPAAVPFRRAR